jgi:uncharacterized damage-inducible protein DinB
MSEQSALAATVAEDFICYYRHLAARVDRAVRSVPREKVWEKPFAFGNSLGHLVLHLTGNLNHYVGALIGGTGYVRDRPLEFTEPLHESPNVILKRFHEAVEMVTKTIAGMDAKTWQLPIADEPPIQTRFGLILVCAAHLNNHIGQMTYLVQALGHSTQEPPIW